MELLYVWRKVGLICSFQSYKGLIRLESGDQAKAWGFFWYSQKIVESLLAVVIGFHLLANKTSWLALGNMWWETQWVNEKQSRMDAHSGPRHVQPFRLSFCLWFNVKDGCLWKRASQGQHEPSTSACDILFSSWLYLSKKKKKNIYCCLISESDGSKARNNGACLFLAHVQRRGRWASLTGQIQAKFVVPGPATAAPFPYVAFCP